MNGKTFFGVVCILITELCERLTYYSISGNLVLYFEGELKLETQQSVTITLVFTGFVYMAPILGGWVADSICGRFNAIYGSLLIYTLGALLLPVTAYNFEGTFGSTYTLTLMEKRIFFFIGLALISLGTGGIKANVGPFGAQQLVSEGPRSVQSFFNWYYWFVNVGSAIAFSAVVYVQQEISFFIGYIIPAGSLIFGLVVFFLPRKYYNQEYLSGSSFSDLFHIISEGCRRKWKSIYIFSSFLDYARIRNGGNFSDEAVNGVITIGRMLPIFGLIIIFWTIYFQSQSSYLVQGQRMNLMVGTFTLPVASLNLFNTIIILVATPLVDRIIFPIIRKFIGQQPSMLWRIWFGLLLSAAASFTAGGIEIARKNDIYKNGPISQIITSGSNAVNASHLSIFYQVPQFMLIGLSEIFSSVTGLEFAFSEAPENLRSIVMGIFLCTSGLGSFLGSGLVELIRVATVSSQWLPDEINNGHFEYFCFLLGGLILFDAVLFIPVAIWYKRQKNKSHETEVFPITFESDNKAYSSMERSNSFNKTSSYL